MDWDCWVEAIAIERRRGPDALYWTEDRINELLHEGKTAEAKRLLRVCELLALLQVRTKLQ